MMPKRIWTSAGLLLLFFLVGTQAPAAWAAPQQAQPSYTLPEYNAYQTCAKETNPQQRIRLCDDFVAKYPSSTLLPYVYHTYYTTYNELKDYPKVMQYADKELSVGDKLE